MRTGELQSSIEGTVAGVHKPVPLLPPHGVRTSRLRQYEALIQSQSTQQRHLSPVRGICGTEWRKQRPARLVPALYNAEASRLSSLVALRNVPVAHAGSGSNSHMVRLMRKSVCGDGSTRLPVSTQPEAVVTSLNEVEASGGRPDAGIAGGENGGAKVMTPNCFGILVEWRRGEFILLTSSES